jgi:hypothetical protein
MAGTPVLCSTACGAADLLQQPWLGTVFASGNVGALSTALREWTARGKRTETERQRIRDWSACITGETIARYFLAIMDHLYHGKARPEAPWRKN